MGVMETQTKNIISKVELADCPEDGGKWAIYCEHINHNGEIVYTAILQDTNKAMLNKFRKDSTEWCEFCRHEQRGGNEETFYSEEGKWF